MKYLCLIYDDEAKLDAMGGPEGRRCIDEHLDYHEALRNSGHFVAAEALQPAAAAAIVQVRHGRLSATDGPFAETKEQLGGFYLIEAQDLNDAIQIAGRIPSARTGRIEVRPVRATRSER